MCQNLTFSQKCITNRKEFTYFFHKPPLMPFSLIACPGLHKYDVRYVRIACTSVTNCKFILDFKSFKITVLYDPMFTSHGFHLYNIETFFSTHPNALSYCSAVTPHSPKICDSVTSGRSLIVTI